MQTTPEKAGRRQIVLLRHGAIKKPARKTYIGQLDLPLSTEGIEQANAWNRYFRDRLPETIICSDLQRAMDMATVIAGSFAERIVINKAFREISLGQWEGVAMDDIRRQHPDQWLIRGENLKTFQPPGGESFADLAERVLPAFDKAITNTSGDLLIVAHAGVNRVILATLLDYDLNDVLQIPQDYASGHLIEIKEALAKGRISATSP